MPSVKVWFVPEGPNPKVLPEPPYILSLNECIEKLGLAKHQRFVDIESTPRIPEQTPGISRLAGNKRVICQISEAAAKASGWESAFYLIELDPHQTAEILKPRQPWGA